MNIRFHCKNFTLSPDLKDYIEYKLTKLTKIINPLGICVFISQKSHQRKKQTFILEIEIHVPKKILRASEKKAPDARIACDLIKDRLKKQVTKYKEKNQFK